jgi:hypothetical protein
MQVELVLIELKRVTGPVLAMRSRPSSFLSVAT